MSFQQKSLNLCVADIAFEETLNLLEWPRLCEQLASFASTVQGKRQCCITSIPIDFETSSRYLSETIELGELDQELEGGLSFRGVFDIDNIIARCAKGGVVSGLELLQVAQTLRSSRRLRRQIEQPQIRPIISELFVNLSTLPELQQLLEFGLEEGGRVADRASEELTSLRKKALGLRMERRDCLKNLMRRYSSYLQDNVIAERNDRPVLVLKANAIERVLGIVHDKSASGNTVYIEPKSVIALGNQISVLEVKILVEEQRLLARWSNEVAINFQALRNLYEILLKVDLALARARYGNWLGGVAPRITADFDTPFIIREFRHPLLVWQARNEQGHAVVPITLEVSSDLRVVAITGPNTGGKTVALKSIGLAIVMARVGLLLPCLEGASLPWCNQVLADIGDEQSLQQNLSTFSGHIVRITRILNALATRSGPSIVLLDELGAGTDPTEGTALAIALLKVLADRARLTIATTHFGELKALKYNDSRFENASVGFNSETMRPTYHLHWGIPGRSNALAIAIRLGFDQAITDHALELINGTGEKNVNDVIQGLEIQRQKQQKAAEQAATLLARTELLHEEIMSRWEKQRQKSKEFQHKGRQELEISIREGQKEVRELIRRLRDRSADGEIARKTGQRLKRIEVSNDSSRINEVIKYWLPKVGDRVRLISLGKSGQVIGVSDDGKSLTVLCGIFRSIVPLRDVESLDGCKPSFSEPVVNVSTRVPMKKTSPVRTKNNTIDVRGLRVYEAEAAVEEKLRNTVSPLWVIHGIGTGRLKRGLIEWLQTLDYVDKVTSADQKDGGSGCSIIWLK